MKTFFTKVLNKLRNIKRKLWLRRLHRKNKNHTFSLITNDCVGGVICHDLGEQFRSPTVNLWIPRDCYLEFVQNLKYYLQCDIEEIHIESRNYPVGRIIPKDDEHIPIEVNFMHYHSFDEAYAKWKERSARVDYDNLYFIWDYAYDDDDRIRTFDAWDVRKLIILHKPIDGIENCEITDCYNENPRNGKILEIKPNSIKRYLDEIDYLGFLNADE